MRLYGSSNKIIVDFSEKNNEFEFMPFVGKAEHSKNI